MIVVAIINIAIFNPLQSQYNHRDNSLASRLLKYHTNLNPQLANVQETINTKVASDSVFSQANADAGLVLGAYDEINPFEDESQIEDSGITKSNPDSIANLIARQVQIYETAPFDTVYTVAEKFGVSTKTIRETNSLPNNALKANWFLVIPPVEGIVIQVTNPNLTLTDVANYYSTDISKIVSYNGLEDAEDMVEIGGYLIIPGGSIPKPKVVAQPSNQAKFKPSIPKASTISGNHKFAPGYCTDYVARKVAGIKWGGNANRWIANSKAYGATVDRNPVAGAILVTSENRRYGHVAYIEKVEGTKVYFSEWNYEGLFITTHRVLDMSDKRVLGIIHP